MIETYGQRYAIEWFAFRGGKELGTGSLSVRPTKPHVHRGVVVSIRSQALNAAHRYLKQNKREYQAGDSWALRINPIGEVKNDS